MLKFNKSISVVVPTHHNDGKGLSPVEVARIATKIDALTLSIGGVTWYDTNGRWHDSEGTIFDDRHRTYVWAFNSSSDAGVILHQLESLLRMVFSEAKQDSIALKLNNDTFLVDCVDLELITLLDEFIRN